MGDRERPLSDLGREQSRKIATALGEQAWVPELILASPAKRAQATAEEIVAAHGVRLEITNLLYDGGVTDIQRDVLCRADAAVTTLMLVGHNPTFSALASTLTGLRISLGTANAPLLHTAEDLWAHAGLMDDAWQLERHLVPV